MAGRFLALTYLSCVLAPTMSFALGDGARAAPCLTEYEHAMGSVREHVHAVSQHVHEDGHHSSLAVASTHEDGQVASATADPNLWPMDHNKSSGGRCCGIMCVNALPATMTEVVRPTAPRCICLSADYQAVDGSAPPRLYRPPIV